MKVYNYNKFKRIVARTALLILVILVALLFLADPLWLLTDDDGILLFIISILVLIMFLFNSRSWFAPFIIDDKGISSRRLGRNIFIPWDEINYIEVKEKGTYRGYNFILCFSKTLPSKNIYRSNNLLRQNKNQFHIVYQDGMLEEILKYVDEAKIKDVERIRDALYPHKKQDIATSWRGKELESYKQFTMEVHLCESDNHMNRLVIREPLIKKVGYVFVTFLSIMLAVFSMPIWGNPTTNWFISGSFFLVMFWLIYITIGCIQWKTEVKDQEIRYRSILKTKTYPLSTITKVEVTRNPNLVILYSHDKKILSASAYCKGITRFVGRLKQNGIDVVNL